ncbi:DedA family protein [Motilibacter aurantiacus]|uniref:DedA family protein n=1 Tax=Motilibacter aurantiacus TaxID=2714955 RepID=UPI00140AEEBD|nr:DedA family protein [Motilibacter aurantiacus]NHC46538.1 DedA family protein [Motilibacter aurantiacus]
MYAATVTVPAHRASFDPLASPASGNAAAELGGLTGWASDVISAAGPVGIALLTALETVVPPIPSEVVLPLAGFLASRGEFGLVAVVVAASIGSLVGSLVLYALARGLGPARARRVLALVPLTEPEDVDRSVLWFQKHGDSSVLLGRLVPGVRSLVSVPAGTARMGVVRFSVLTFVGSAVWNSLLVGVGYALGQRWHEVSKYADLIDYVVIAAVVLLVGAGVVRKVRKVRASR